MTKEAREQRRQPQWSLSTPRRRECEVDLPPRLRPGAGTSSSRVFYHEAPRAQTSPGSPVRPNENATRRQVRRDVAAGHVPASLLSGLAALAGRGAAGTGVCVHVCNTDVSPGELEAGDVEEKLRQTFPRPPWELSWGAGTRPRVRRPEDRRPGWLRREGRLKVKRSGLRGRGAGREPAGPGSVTPGIAPAPRPARLTTAEPGQPGGPAPQPPRGASAWFPSPSGRCRMWQELAFVCM